MALLQVLRRQVQDLKMMLILQIILKVLRYNPLTEVLPSKSVVRHCYKYLLRPDVLEKEQTRLHGSDLNIMNTLLKHLNRISNIQSFMVL